MRIAVCEQDLRHFSKTFNFACALRTQNQRSLKNGEHVGDNLSLITPHLRRSVDRTDTETAPHESLCGQVQTPAQALLPPLL